MEKRLISPISFSKGSFFPMAILYHIWAKFTKCGDDAIIDRARSVIGVVGARLP